jgi:hypothetical protein
MSFRILALDMARITGWAEGEIGRAPLSGTIRFAPPKSSHEEVFGQALEWMHERLQVSKPDLIIVEAPVTKMHNAAFLLFGLPAVIGAVANRHGVPRFNKGHVQSARKHFIGKGRLKTSDATKSAVRAECISRGWVEKNDCTYDQCDALCLWDYACAARARRFGIQTTEFFLRNEVA